MLKCVYIAHPVYTEKKQKISGAILVEEKYSCEQTDSILKKANGSQGSSQWSTNMALGYQE